MFRKAEEVSSLGSAALHKKSGKKSGKKSRKKSRKKSGKSREKSREKVGKKVEKKDRTHSKLQERFKTESVILWHLMGSVRLPS